MAEISGYIERITFHNGETGFTVAKMQEEGKKELTCLVGKMAMVQPGETVRVVGQWKMDPYHGQQFAVDKLLVEAPATVLGIEKYLGSGLVNGIGPVYAKRIVKQFGEDTLTVIDEDPRRLLEVEGIGKGRLKKIESCWSEQRTIREVMVFLQSYGVTPTLAQKIFRLYREESLTRLREDPYCLARDIAGIGFKTADQIAQQMGVARDAPRRISAGIEHVLALLSEEGHVCYPLDEFYEKAQEVLEVDGQLVADQVGHLIEGHRVVVEKERIWLKNLYLTELGIASEIERLLAGQCNLRTVDSEKAAAWVQEKLRIRLASQQVEAVQQALTDKVQVITGGPGTGKSTIQRAILTITKHLTRKILLAAPTGRAAKRMAEITGHHAQTIHSLLEYDFRKMGFKRGRDNPLSCDLMIVDEASMIDTSLMRSLLQAIPAHARLVLVGDTDQLPSVGPGNVLSDLIESDTIPLTRLTQIFRQAAGSQIISNAHRIRKGIFPDLETDPEADFFFIEEDEPERVRDAIVGLVSQRLPRRYGFNPIDDIQVLAPMRRGIIGTEQLGASLQQALNPSDSPFFASGRQFHLHDKVMQIRNDYDKKVFNGDIGRIVTVEAGDRRLIVNFDGRPVAYEPTDIDSLVPAYAVSIHKYQGSECPCIVMPIHTAHFKLLQRNLLYTGLTRGKKLVVIVGSKKAIAMAVQTDSSGQRHTGLKEALQSSMKTATTPAVS